MSNSKKNICVLFGGRSVEHEISIISALQLMESLDRELYDLVPAYIAQSGKWYTGNELLKKEFYQDLPACLEKLTEVTLLPKPGLGGLTVVKNSAGSVFSKFFGGENQVFPVDVYIPAFHGTYGEDGCIQGLLEMADAAYASSNVLSSSVAMNKAVCKAVAGYSGIPVLPFALVSKREMAYSITEARKKVLSTPGLEDFPLFIKPVHLGSSIGIAKAKTPEELDAALAGVFKYDDTAIVEPCVTSIMEINVSVLDSEKRIASVTEIPVGTDGMLSYEDKYMSKGGAKKGKLEDSQGMASLSRAIDPKDLDLNIKESVIAYALKLAEIIGSSGVGRYDFIVDTAKNQIYFNELNPIPGSLSFYLWEKSKPPIIYPQLLNKIIERALQRKTEASIYEKNTGFKALFKLQ